MDYEEVLKHLCALPGPSGFESPVAQAAEEGGFCILDEIETSLDEVNVSNFAEYVKRYSEDTQFILITHRKGSMEVCNALYGVAMEEKGISKIVSARFNESA